ncbi:MULTISPECIES: DUF1816 domain-containing protein [unclassified Picosynechococcus]|uniref:DUF1816 domain-containing protein n=1 Tax=unclassified Picosynechococcus TaxID=3079910 RepID=UPI0007458FAD|nr:MULTISPECIES: DUF1816 domain-containing protein [unclassified Picosynechococcus]AMA08203.1 hypothetical protein AWQ23_02105 [Picosynechococcus sp. PCC 73109]ANV86347.1 hypothetical protein AWQ22_02015 [Picosynechococcus sp. PCC 7117]QCS49026.1 DUF1816 domain-containing protein [Picosynechococcus sp. PCC 11901]
MKELLLKLFETIGRAYWLEITTEQPECTYYFGPYLSRKEAIAAQPGFLEDLTNEGAQNIDVNLQRCRTPKELTIFDDSGSKKTLMPIFSFSH